MSKCHYCVVDGHDICWDAKPDPTCPCCVDTATRSEAKWVHEDFDEWSELTQARDAYRADAEAEWHRNPYA